MWHMEHWDMIYFIQMHFLLPSSAQAKLIQAGLRLALISGLAGRPAGQPARKSFFSPTESWNFASNLNSIQLALIWEKNDQLVSQNCRG